jgi:hypothetical protein
VKLRIVLADGDEAIGLLEGQWSQQYSVDGREDCRVGADGERKRQRGRPDEPWIATEPAHRKPRIGRGVFEPPRAAPITM